MPLAERRRELTLGPVGPWQAVVTVDAVETNTGRKTTTPQEWLFEVIADWFGPPMVGMPPSSEPVASRDVYVVKTLEDARTLARKAEEAFSKGGEYPPDLRQLATGKPAAEQPRSPRFWTPPNGAK